MNILIIGEHGMVAHVMYMYLKEQGHNVKALSIRDQELNEINFGGGYDLVINCVGILVEESYKNLDKAVLYNAYLPHLLEAYYKDTNTKVIHISTDCVHDGTFYGRSKALGEIENGKDLTLRMSVIGADKNPDGTGLFNWFMKQENEVDGYEYALWNGITTLQLAKSIVPAMRLTGIYNLVPKRGVSNTTYSECSTMNLIEVLTYYQ